MNSTENKLVISNEEQKPYKSKKRLAKEAKELKKLQNQRTKPERQLEIDNVFSKLQELGITKEMVGEFNKIATDYIELNFNASGYVKLPELKRVLIYSLPNDKRIQVATMLRAL
jgi:hypothetical protein